jgi:hypothetical protein
MMFARVKPVHVNGGTPLWIWEECNADGESVPYGYASMPMKSLLRAMDSAREHGFKVVAMLDPEMARR